MSSIILSIKPQYVKLILNESKKYEFRKIRCKEDIKTIYIYETAPKMKIVAEVEVIEIIERTPKEIWSICNEYSGISKEDYDKYYSNSDRAIAYKLGKIKKYETPKTLQDFGLNSAPQSFVYIK